RARGEAADQVPALGPRDVDGDRLLRAVQAEEVAGLRRLAPFGVAHEGRAPTPRVVADAGPLDLDDFRAEITEDLARAGPGEDARHVEHAHALERAGQSGASAVPRK